MFDRVWWCEPQDFSQYWKGTYDFIHSFGISHSPRLVFQHLNLHISHSCKLLKRSHLFLLCLITLHFSLVACLQKQSLRETSLEGSELESNKIDFTVKLSSNACNFQKFKNSPIHFWNTSFTTLHFFWLGCLILMSQISFLSSWHCQNKSAGHTSKATPTPSKPVASHVTQPGMSASPLLHFFSSQICHFFWMPELFRKKIHTSLKTLQLPARTKAASFICYSFNLFFKRNGRFEIPCCLNNITKTKTLNQCWFVFKVCLWAYYPFSNPVVNPTASSSQISLPEVFYFCLW